MTIVFHFLLNKQKMGKSTFQYFKIITYKQSIVHYLIICVLGAGKQKSHFCIASKLKSMINISYKNLRSFYANEYCSFLVSFFINFSVQPVTNCKRYTCIGFSQTACKQLSHHYCIHPKIFQCLYLLHLSQMDAGIMHSNCMQVFDAETLYAGIGCSIVACIQIASSACNYCIKITTNINEDICS